MSVRCKFKVDSVTKTATNGATVAMSPVSTGSDENKKFFKWTPSGELKFQTINDEAADQLVPGAEYYIDITPVPKAE